MNDYFENIDVVLISYFRGSKFKDLDYKHNEEIDIKGFLTTTKERYINYVISDILSKGYNIMLKPSKVLPHILYLSIDDKNFRQR